VYLFRNDIMIRKPTYEELEQTLAHLMGELEAVSKQAGELKRSFLSMISHEMRTPLHAILGLAEIMATTDLTQEEKEEYVTQINQCGNNLLQVVQNMIDAAMLEAGDVKLCASACVVADIMDEVYQYFNLEKRRQDKWAIALLRSVSLPSNDFTIINDKERLKQVLGNLLDNALKFTERGVIELGCYIPQEQTIRFFVKDSGVGADPGNVQQIFGLFAKAAPTKEKLFNGTGLGLTIARGLVELMGGKISVFRNELGGSTFCVDLPFKIDKLSAQPDQLLMSLKKNIA